MKTLFILLALTGCTQKYTSFDLVRKVDFNRETYERPIPVTQVMPEGKDELKSCFNQWLFFSNAEKEKDQAIPFIIRSLCPGKEYLLDTEMTERWLTTILYSQSCVMIDTKCGLQRKLK
jgi:hypothetical protein